jgi:protein-tyrosine phosphatase
MGFSNQRLKNTLRPLIQACFISNHFHLISSLVLVKLLFYSMIQKKIVFVCLGNICRSPLAEAIFKLKIREKNLERYLEADSCGTANYHVGGSPDPRTIANATKNGVAIKHVGRQLSETDLENFDIILAMDQSNYDNILRLSNSASHQSKIKLMREYDSIGKGNDVPDPYYGSEKNFQEVFEILDRSIESFIEDIKKSIDQEK